MYKKLCFTQFRIINLLLKEPTSRFTKLILPAISDFYICVNDSIYSKSLDSKLTNKTNLL